ncbi:uncharacterized protein LOC100575701 [Acyrthosiphon pisum]|uniref:W2 domain-containing protein n=1 Tax=Acyrthosiphon pisum TaxID=7029 RepID=A0A8R1W9F0_ACYPI|nr:uncharacterized protein LOC100575701 [Acyrthosiphon pisum]|eukprot:XP_003245851.1 PREDICTED: uncharacterized protein LOC100575701 [Acyrthosiphon pisum]
MKKSHLGNQMKPIATNISAEVIKCPQFMRALTIAIFIDRINSIHPNEDFLVHCHVKLLTHYIQSEALPVSEIIAREVQCLYGFQIMSAALEYPEKMVLRLFHHLYQDSVISKESFQTWKKDDKFNAGFDEDLETKNMTVLNSFFIQLELNDSDEDDTSE